MIRTDALSSLPRSFWSALSSFLSVLRSFKPHIVHAHTRRGLFLCNLARRIIPFPLVFTAHAKFSASGAKRLFTDPPKFTVAVSEDIKKHFVKAFGARSDGITVIENGIDTDRFRAEKPLWGALRILNVSRLDSDCSLGAELLCKIAPRLSESLPVSQIVIVGGGNDLGRIKGLATAANRAVGREIVRCVGATADVLPLILDSNLFVGVSRAALEAMCCNRPVLICGNEGYLGLCTEDNFFAASHGNFCARGYSLPDAERLFFDICAFYNAKDSKKHYLRERVAERYGAHSMASQTLTVYRKTREDFSKTRKADVVLCGYYGFGNLGDELVQRSIREKMGDLSVKVIGAGGDGRISRLDLVGICSAIRGSRAFVMGGGSLLQNSTSRRSLGYYLLILRIAAFFGRPTMLYANGIGPIEGERALEACRFALKNADVVSVRDSASLEALESLLTKKTLRYLSCDPALCLLEQTETEKRIAIFIRGEDCCETLALALKRALLSFRKEVSCEHEIVFASMNQKRDERAAHYLCEAMPFDAHCKCFGECSELSDFIARSELVLSSRLHALIVAASAGVPFLALGHDPKLEGFVYECELPKILAPSLSDSLLWEKIFYALKYATTHREEISRQISDATALMLSRGEKDSTELAHLIGTSDG